MKTTIRYLIFVILLLSCEGVFAQATYVARRNDDAATTQILSNGGLGSLAVTLKGKLWGASDQVAGTAYLASIPGSFGLGVSQDPSAYTFFTSLGQYTPFGTNIFGALYGVMDERLQTSDAFQVLKLEDSVAGSADAGVATFGVINPTNASKAASGDYTSPALSLGGAALDISIYDATVTAALQIGKLEDTVHASADAGMPIWSVAQDPSSLAVFASSGDYIPTAANTYGAPLGVLDQRLQTSDKYGALKLNNSTTGASTDAVIGMAGKVDINASAGYTDGKYGVPEMSAKGYLYSAPAYDAGLSSLLNPIHLEDAATADTDAGFASYFGVNTGFATKTNTTLDYVLPSTGREGQVYTTLTIDNNLVQTAKAVENEDNAAVDAAGGVPTLAVVQNPPAAGFGEVAGDYGWLSTDNLNVLYTRTNKYEDAVAGSGDDGYPILGVANQSLTTLVANGDYVVPAHSIAGVALGTLIYDANIAGGLRAVSQEDLVASSGDAGVPSLGVANQSLGTLAANGDYILSAHSVAGVALGALMYDSTLPTGLNAIKQEDLPSTSADGGVAILGVRNDALATLTSLDADYTFPAFGKLGDALVSPVYNSALATGSALIRQESSAHTNADAGLAAWQVVQDPSSPTLWASDQQYVPSAANPNGTAYVGIDERLQTSDTFSILKLEDAVAANGTAGVAILGKILAIPVAQAADADYGQPLLNDLNALYTDPVRRGAFTPTQPTVTNTTSFTCLASNTARRGYLIQNNSAANIMVNPNNGTLTGIVPTSTNLGDVLTPGSSISTPPNASPTAAVTCYQSSGGSINTISVTEW